MGSNDANHRASRLLEPEETKMKVKIIETGKTETLSLIAASGICWAQDCVGNQGALNDGQFQYSEDHDAYLCSQETFNWWSRYFSAQQAVYYRIEALKIEHGNDAVNEAILAAEAGYNDLEDQPAIISQALDEAFGE